MLISKPLRHLITGNLAGACGIVPLLFSIRLRNFAVALLYRSFCDHRARSAGVRDPPRFDDLDYVKRWR
jgi:hypothetical protein